MKAQREVPCAASARSRERFGEPTRKAIGSGSASTQYVVQV
jgi:hypothetical protein